MLRKILLISFLIISSYAGNKSDAINEDSKEYKTSDQITILNQNGKLLKFISEDIFFINANTKLEEGYDVEIIVDVLTSNDKILASESKYTTVNNGEVSAKFNLDEIIVNHDINESLIIAFKAKIRWQ